MKHSPENWTYNSENNNDYIDIESVCGFRICSIDLVASHEKEMLSESIANAKRIVNCVNACQGIPDEYLDNDLIQKLFFEYLAQQSQK